MTSNDAYTGFIELGSPKVLRVDQIGLLNQMTADRPNIQTLSVKRNGIGLLTIPMRAYDVLLVELIKS